MVSPEAPAPASVAPGPAPARGAFQRAAGYARLLLEGADLDAPYRALPREGWLLAAVVILGAALRFLGLRLGLPYFHHWDEVLVTQSAHGMLDRADDIPSNFFYGAPLMRLTAIGTRAALALHFSGVTAATVADEVGLRWVGRAIACAIASSGTAAVYLAGRFAFRRGDAALWGALMYAAASELIWHARFLVTDASVVALTAWTLALSAGYLRRRSLLLGLLAVLACGISFSFKLTGLATMLLPAGSLLARAPVAFATSTAEGELQRYWLAVAHRALLLAAVPAVVLLFLRLNPHFIDMWQRALADVEGLRNHYRGGHVKPFSEREPGVEHTLSALYFIVAQSLSTRAWLSLSLSAVGLYGLGLALLRANLAVLLGVVHALGVVVVMAWPNRAYLTRMYMPALPVLCVGFGLGAASLLERARTRPGRARRAAVGLALVGLLAEPTYQAVEAFRLGSDSRVRAMDLIERLAESGAGTVTVALTPAVAGSLALGAHGALRGYLGRPRVRFLPDVADAAAAAGSGADYVVLASHRDLKRIWPYEEQWVFTEVPGYRAIARLPFSPYEHRLDLVPTWDGRVTTIVLARGSPSAAP